MTRRLERTPTAASLVVHTEADHIAGACASGCPWCKMPPQPTDEVVVLDDDTPQQPETP